MLRRLVLLALMALLALPAAAGAEVRGAFIAGAAIDGPGVQRLGDLDVARDGTGALTYTKGDHVFVSRLVGGAFQPPEQLDVGLAGASSQPVVAASDGGNLVVAFVTAGTLVAAARPVGAAGFTPLQPIAAGATNPDVDMSINGVAYLTWSAGGNVGAARKERNGPGFTGLPAPLDIDPAADAGTGTGAPRVAVAADGVATVVWGESGHAFARRLFELRLSAAPQDLGADADEPDIATEDDSSYAWAVFRQSGRAVARRLVGSQFDPPVSIDGGAAAEAPRVAITGKGIGYAGVQGAGTGLAYGAALKRDVFNPGVVLGGGAGPSLPVPAVDQSGDGLIAFQQAGGVIARRYDFVAVSKLVTPAGQPAGLSNPALGPVDAASGLEADGDRAGDFVVAYVQGPAGAQSVVVATFDRAPGLFRGSTGTRFRRLANVQLKWSPSFELWGPVTYTVFVDDQPIAQTAATGVPAPPTLPDGVHRWRVVATDSRGQATSTPTRILRLDGTAPTVGFTVRLRKGRVARVAAQASDASATGARTSGIKDVSVSFGDGSKAVHRRTAEHRYARRGRFTVRVTATDKAGNVAVAERRVTFRARADAR
jgi:PKD domain